MSSRRVLAATAATVVAPSSSSSSSSSPVLSLPEVNQTSPVFPDKDVLTAATEWTKKRIFSGSKNMPHCTNSFEDDNHRGHDASDYNYQVGGGRSGSVAGTGTSLNLDPPVNGPLALDNTNIIVSSVTTDNQFLLLVTYTAEGLVQLFSTYSTSTSAPLRYVGSTYGIEGKIIKADLVFIDAKTYSVLVQVVSKRTLRMEIHSLFVGEKPSFVQTLTDLLPGSGSGGPFEVVVSDDATKPCGKTEGYFAVVSPNGRVSIYSTPKFKRCSIFGIDTCFGADNRPLLAISGNWLAYCPNGSQNTTSNGNGTTKNGTTISSSSSSSKIDSSDSESPQHEVHYKCPRSKKQWTKVVYPPSGPLHQRLMTSLSNTAVTSLTTLSEASLASVRHYFNDAPKSDSSKGSSATKQHYEYEGDDDSDDTSGTRPTRTSGSSPTSTGGLQSLSSLVFGDSDTNRKVHVVTLSETGTQIAYFPALRGVSKLSFSPFDTTLLVASTRGDYIDTYDLTFAPRQVNVKNVYIRGRLPGEISQVVWASNGCFGVTTNRKGSLHWFNGSTSSSASTDARKLLKMSGWDIGTAGVSRSCLYVYRQGQIFVVNLRNGQCVGKYDLPLSPVTMKSVTIDSAYKPGYDTADLQKMNHPNPLSQYELETCMAYPYFHTDRRVTLKVLADREVLEIYTQSSDNYVKSAHVFCAMFYTTRELKLGPMHNSEHPKLDLNELADAIDETPYVQVDAESELNKGDKVGDKVGDKEGDKEGGKEDLKEGDGEDDKQPTNRTP